MLVDVDNFAKSIHTSLRERNLSNIVDVIFVSDHGMTNTSNSRLVYLDDVMGEEYVAQIEHEEGMYSSSHWSFMLFYNRTPMIPRMAFGWASHVQRSEYHGRT